MPAPDLITPDRLDELLGGALPEGEREARLQGLVRELRAEAPPAPPTLLERVRALGEEPPRRRRLVLPERRLALAVVVMLATFALVSGLIAGLGGGGLGDDSDERNGALALEAAPAAPTIEAEELVPPSPAPYSRADSEEAAKDGDWRAATLDHDTLGSDGDLSDMAARFPPNRATDVKLWMEVRLADANELSDAANDSMTITRELGGWVAGSEIDTQGNEGRAELALRVPVTRIEDAIVRLGDLGTVTGQQVETVDLQAAIDRRDARIENVLRAIRTLELRLETEDLTPAQEIEIKLDLADRRNELADLRRGNRADRREAATSELTLVLHTREAPGGAEKDEGGLAGAADDALSFLGDAGAIALFLAIVLSPVVLVAVLLWIALRSRTRRIETRILERQTPSAPPTP